MGIKAYMEIRKDIYESALKYYESRFTHYIATLSSNESMLHAVMDTADKFTLRNDCIFKAIHGAARYFNGYYQIVLA